MAQVPSPFTIFQDAYGNPLEGGKIYIGTVSQNSETSPITVYWDQAGTIPAAQPIRTIGGYPTYQGAPANIYVSSSYSILVKDKNGALVFTSPVNQVDPGINAIFYGWKNYVSQSSFEDGTSTGWNLGKDTGTITPLSGGIGGGTSSFLPLTIEKVTPLAGGNSLSLNKPASNIQGSTLYSNNMTIDREDTLSVLEIDFTYQTPVTVYTTDDYKVFLWDVTGGALVALSTNSLPGTLGLPGRFSATCTTTSNTVYRIIIMCVSSANVSALSMLMDSVIFRPALTVSNALTLGGSSLSDTKKWSIELLYEVGSIHEKLDFKPPVVWSPGSPNTYFPAIDLSALTDVQVFDSTGSSSGLSTVPFTKIVSPGAVTWLRAFKATIRRGKATQKTDFTLSTFTVTGTTTATLVFAVDTDVTAILAAFGEDASVAGATADLLTYTPDYTKSWVMNLQLALTVGGTTIPAGDYVMTSVTASTRTVVFTIPVTANVGATATSVACTFYPFRIAGSTTTARIFASQGRVLQGANDGLLENVSGGRRRGRGQGHIHNSGAARASGASSIGIYGESTEDAPGSAINVISAGAGTADHSPKTSGPKSDGTNGTPRTGPETDVRSTIVHFYFGLGALDA